MKKKGSTKLAKNMKLKRKLLREKKKTKIYPLSPRYFVEYYSLAFKELMIEIKEDGYDFHGIHNIRYRFWKMLKNEVYSQEESKQLLLNYYEQLENELKIISNKSIAYWLRPTKDVFPNKDEQGR